MNQDHLFDLVSFVCSFTFNLALFFNSFLTHQPLKRKSHWGIHIVSVIIVKKMHTKSIHEAIQSSKRLSSRFIVLPLLRQLLSTYSYHAFSTSNNPGAIRAWATDMFGYFFWEVFLVQNIHIPMDTFHLSDACTLDGEYSLLFLEGSFYQLQVPGING